MACNAAALLPAALQANQVVQARYNSSAGAFDIIPQNGWVRLSTVDASAASTVDFTSIPAGVNHLMLLAEGTVSSNGVSLNMRTYGADGVVDTGSSDYGQNLISNSGGGTLGSTTATGSAINLAGDVGTGTVGFSCTLTSQNIQAATKTKFTWQMNTQGSINYSNTQGIAYRDEADRITGIRIYPTSGTVTGKFTLLAMA